MVKQVLITKNETCEKKKEDANKTNPIYKVSERLGVPMEDNTLPFPLESVSVEVRRQMDKKNPGK